MALTLLRLAPVSASARGLAAVAQRSVRRRRAGGPASPPGATPSAVPGPLGGGSQCLCLGGTPLPPVPIRGQTSGAANFPGLFIPGARGEPAARCPGVGGRSAGPVPRAGVRCAQRSPARAPRCTGSRSGSDSQPGRGLTRSRGRLGSRLENEGTPWSPTGTAGIARGGSGEAQLWLETWEYIAGWLWLASHFALRLYFSVCVCARARWRDCYGFSAKNRLGVLKTGDEAGVCIVGERGEDICGSVG